MTTDTPPIEIPDGLKPRDGRFCSGPSKVRLQGVHALAETGRDYLGTSHRQEGVRSVVRGVRDGLRELFALPDGYEVVLWVGGASVFWDAAACCLIERCSQHLAFGEFSQKFASAVEAAPHLDAPEVLTSEPGDHPDPKPSAGVDAYCYPHNETSTGVAMEVVRPAPEGLVLVDATSAAGALRVDPRAFDAYYFAPQKAFASDAGLGMALCSSNAIERIERLAKARDRWVPAMLDLAIALENSRKDQTYNTPPLASLFLMRDTIRWMLDHGGLGWAASRCDRNAEVLYTWAEKTAYTTPFVRDPQKRSRSVATIDFSGEVDAAAVARVLRANGVLDTEPYRKLARNQLRIGLYPAIDSEDVEALTHCIEHVVERLG